MKTNPKSDLQKLVEDFENLKFELESLDEADKESEGYVREAYQQAERTAALHRVQLAGNSRSRREKQVKLANIQELLGPILFPMKSEDDIDFDSTLHELLKRNP